MAQILGNPEFCWAPAGICVKNIGVEVVNPDNIPGGQLRKSFGNVYLVDQPHCVSAQIGSCPGPAPLEKTAIGLSCPHTRCTAHEDNQLA